MSRGRRIGIVAVVLPVALLAVLAVSWFVDEQIHDDQVVRNVSVSNVAVGGLGQPELQVAVESLAESYPSTEVSIELPDRTIETTIGEIGGSIDVDATVAEALDARRDQALLLQPGSWLRSLFTSDERGVQVTFSESDLRAAITELEGDSRVEPTEPKVNFTEFGYVVAPGADGSGIAPIVVEQAIVAAADEGAVDSITVTTEQQAVPPRFTDEEAELLATRATGLVEAGISISAGGENADVPPETLGPWLSSRPGQNELELFVRRGQISEDLPSLLNNVGRAPTPASFTVEGGKPVVVPSEAGTGCCASGSGASVLEALENGDTTVELNLTRVEPERDTAWAESLGIIEEITLPDEAGCSQFSADPCRRTTHHDCCGSRVTNIHLMADKTRGYIIEPGGYFSPNEIVGPRTAEGGFATAGAIEDGEHVEVVGGGVSQFATTSFNAAFFAGLDIPRYFMHDEYFSRYPYGRESTISYPEPEFRIQNNTPHGVLVWPVYTDTSLTVHLYSTRYATGAVAGQSTSTSGNCTQVTTSRTRTYVDGHTESDSFSGNYRNDTSKPTC
jgi:vancomycin resistance protein YoaR